MDEHELEQRLRARLHARYDAGGPSEAYRAKLLRSLTPEAARGGRLRLAVTAAWPILAAAAVVVIAVGVLSLRPASPVGPGAVASATPTPVPSATASPSAAPSASASPSPSGSPSAVPSPSTAGPDGSVPPQSTTSWTGLTVQPLASAPDGLQTVVPWSGGYLGLATDAVTGAATPWTSRDGRSWTALPPDTFGLNDTSGNTTFLGGTSCGSGVMVLMRTNGNAEIQWSTSDGVTHTWSSSPLTGDRSGTVAGTNPGGSIAGAGSGAIRPALSGLAVDVTTDCATWQTVRLPGATDGRLTAVAANASGFVAVGYAGSPASSNVEPRAWQSADGLHWTAATVAAKKGDGFSAVYAGASGFVATSVQPEVTPGIVSLWTSADGTSWTPSSADPLGVVDQCAGSGSVAGSFAGDGTHLLVYGPKGGCSGPLEYWTSLDGAHWTKLALAGDGAAVTAGGGDVRASLMRDGILFGATAGTWFGAVVNP